ncbi:MAG: N-6 DNA methylase [Desulfobacterales bacterium]|nr:N-6 DNA methylase [Desulfobacterales bacterium]
MTTVTKIDSRLVREHQSTPPGMLFYDSVEAVRRDISLLGYVSVVERAWQEMDLNGVLFLDSRPVLYLKEYGQPASSAERIRLQKLFWNQGVANVLVLADPTTVSLYSGLTKPQPEQLEGPKAEKALIGQPLALAEYVQQIQALYHDLATGNYYEKYAERFNPDEAVDATLLRHLKELRDELIKGEYGLGIKEAHAIIGRVLFLCYLLDRGIVTIGPLSMGNTATSCFAQILGGKPHKEGISYLYGLFNDLKERFNGNMFDLDLDAEKESIQTVHIEKLIRFLGGHDVKSGQLNIWPYDFKMIPVETISAIYEDFLAVEDPEGKKGQGAFYTPRFLAEMVVDTAVGEDPDLLDGSFLDPACGSGIFLVILFNRIANRWVFNQVKTPGYLKKAEALQSILKQQIRGVDKKETACRIACFSLYLAYLDFFDPPDIIKYVERTGSPLPKLLHYGDTPNRPQADMPVVYKADFINGNSLGEEKFDCIIGNPPWAERGRKQLALKFMEKTPDFLKESGVGCLLLPTKNLHNQTDAFQAKWLLRVELEKVIQLADYSFLLFKNALCPAFIARFKNTPPQPAKHLIEFVAPKFNRDGLRQGLIIVNPSSRTWIPLSDILAATELKTASVLWKRWLWGTSRDQKLIDLLWQLPSLGAHVDVLSELRKQRKERKKRWIIGQGIKPWLKSKKKSDRLPKKIIWPLDTPFIAASPWHSNQILMESDTIPIEERLKKKEYRTDIFYSQPPQDLFKPPMIVVSQGFEKVAYCDFNVLFQHSLQSIAGPKNDSDLLVFLSVFLRSSLARYFLFHTSANWGTERDKVLLDELLRVPFPLPGHEFVSPDGGRIVRHVFTKFKSLRRKLVKTFNKLKQDSTRFALFPGDEPDIGLRWRKERKILVDAFQNDMEPLIYNYFGLTEQEIALVEDTIRVFEPSSTPHSWRSPKSSLVTLDPLEKAKAEPYVNDGLNAYADMLTGTLNGWAQMEGSIYRVRAEGGISKKIGIAMISLTLAERAGVFRQKNIEEGLARQLNDFHRLVAKDHGKQRYERDLFLFQGKNIHVIRPNILFNWTRTAALNDAARIYGEIAQAGED